MYEQMLRARRSRRRNLILGFVVIGFAFAVGMGLRVGGVAGLELAAIIAFVTCIPGSWLLVPVNLSKTEYYSLDGSQTPSDKPRCIHCGHVGLYTHGKYKTATKCHDCSKCGTTLYTS